MIRSKFKFLFIFFISISCSQLVKWDYEDFLVSEEITGRSYSVIKSGNNWIACSNDYLEGKDRLSKRSYLVAISKRSLTDDEQSYCAVHYCTSRSEDVCINEGNYLVFSEVVIDTLTNNFSRFTSSDFKAYDWKKEEVNCLQEGQINSCSIVSNYHRFITKKRKKFFEIRKRECELLKVEAIDCSYDF